MNAPVSIENKASDLTSRGLLWALVVLALLLAIRIVYLFLADAHRFPINTVKVVATYQHITRKEIETILSNYKAEGFFSISTNHLRHDLASLNWVDKVDIERIWPNTLKIKLLEKKPLVIWNHQVLAQDGSVIKAAITPNEAYLPQLSGPKNQQQEVLQIYQKLSKLLATYGLKLASLELRNNQAYELELLNGIKIYLGKQDIQQRLQRFCNAYKSVFADNPEQLMSVDLRYSHGFAVQWK